MPAQGLWINTPLMVLALGIGLVLRQAACAERSAGGRAGCSAGGSELTDMIDASEPETCPACGGAPERGCECDAVESARLLASSF